MDAAAEIGRNLVNKNRRFSLSMEMSTLTGDGTGRPNPSHETKFSGANADREIFIFSVQLITGRIGNLTRLILTLAICVTIHTHIHTKTREQAGRPGGSVGNLETL